MIFLFGLNDNAQIKQPNIIQNNNVKEPKQPVETIRLNSNTIVAQTISQNDHFSRPFKNQQKKRNDNTIIEQ